MTRRRWTACILIAAALLSGCAATQKQCEGANWEQLGYNDGLRGPSAASGESGLLLNTCAQSGVVPDRSAYERGRRSGLVQWCGRDWYSMGRDDGLRGAQPRDMGAAYAACAPLGAGVDGAGYQAGYRQGGEQFCARLDWVGQGHKIAAEGKVLDPGAVHGNCRALGISPLQRADYEQGAARFCRTIDWRAMGRKQAESGRPADAQVANPPACSMLGMRPDTFAFHAGYESFRQDRQARLEQQCSRRALFDAGRAGRPFDGACSEFGHARRAHDGGRQHSQLEAERRALEAQVAALNRAPVPSSGTPPAPAPQAPQTSRPPQAPQAPQAAQPQRAPQAPQAPQSAQEPQPAQGSSSTQKAEELRRLNQRIRDLTERMDELARQSR